MLQSARMVMTALTCQRTKGICRTKFQVNSGNSNQFPTSLMKHSFTGLAVGIVPGSRVYRFKSKALCLTKTLQGFKVKTKFN